MSGSHLSRDFFELVKAIGESKSKQEEDRIIVREVQNLKQRIGEKQISGVRRARRSRARERRPSTLPVTRPLPPPVGACFETRLMLSGWRCTYFTYTPYHIPLNPSLAHAPRSRRNTVPSAPPPVDMRAQ